MVSSYLTKRKDVVSPENNMTNILSDDIVLAPQVDLHSSSTDS